MLELRGEAGVSRKRYPPEGRQARRRGPLPRLEGVLCSDILPALMQAHARAASAALPVEDFARDLLDDDDDASRRAVARLSAACGDDLGRVHDALAPAARRLHDLWLEDACDFFAVSQAVARLRAILASLAEPEAGEARTPTMLMLTPPGEAHRFGAEMAADLFRREGWRVERGDGDLRALDHQTFQAIGVSCGCDRSAASLPRFISDIRARAHGPRAPIVLGGALYEGHQARARNPAVDFVASDPDLTRRLSQALLKPRRA